MSYIILYIMGCHIITHRSIMFQVGAQKEGDTSLDLAEVRIIDETKLTTEIKRDLEPSTKGTNNNKTKALDEGSLVTEETTLVTEEPPEIPQRAVKEQLVTEYLTVDISMDSQTSDIETCRDYENVDLARIRNMSLSDLPGIFGDMMDGKLKESDTEASASEINLSLIAMSPDQNTTLEIHHHGNMSSVDVPESPAMLSEKLNLTLVAPESDISGVNMISKSCDASCDITTEAPSGGVKSENSEENDETVDTSSESLDLRLRTEPVSMETTSPPSVYTATHSKDMKPVVDDSAESEADDDLDYESFMSTLNLRHSVSVPSVEGSSSDISSDTECDDNMIDHNTKVINVISTPYKVKVSNTITRVLVDTGASRPVITEPCREQTLEVTSQDEQPEDISPVDTTPTIPAPAEFSSPVSMTTSAITSPPSYTMCEIEGNRTYDLLKSYINITITPEGTVEKLPELPMAKHQPAVIQEVDSDTGSSTDTKDKSEHTEDKETTDIMSIGNDLDDHTKGQNLSDRDVDPTDVINHFDNGLENDLGNGIKNDLESDSVCAVLISGATVDDSNTDNVITMATPDICSTSMNTTQYSTQDEVICQDINTEQSDSDESTVSSPAAEASNQLFMTSCHSHLNTGDNSYHPDSTDISSIGNDSEQESVCVTNDNTDSEAGEDFTTSVELTSDSDLTSPDYDISRDNGSLTVECSQTEPNLTMDSDVYEHPQTSANQELDLTYEDLRVTRLDDTNTSIDSGRYYDGMSQERFSTRVGTGGLSMDMIGKYVESSSMF